MNTLIERLDEYARNCFSDGVHDIGIEHPHTEKARSALVAGIEALQTENAELRKDAELLDFVEEHPHLSLRKYKNRWSFVGLTNYEYSTFDTAREAIQATLDASKY